MEPSRSAGLLRSGSDVGALKKANMKKKRTSGPSGQHQSRRRIISEGRPGEFGAWDRAARNSGDPSWAHWARRVMNAAAQFK